MCEFSIKVPYQFLVNNPKLVDQSSKAFPSHEFGFFLRGLLPRQDAKLGAKFISLMQQSACGRLVLDRVCQVMALLAKQLAFALIKKIAQSTTPLALKKHPLAPIPLDRGQLHLMLQIAYLQNDFASLFQALVLFDHEPNID